MVGDIVTSVRVQTTPGHDLVTVWNRGGSAGTLTVQRHDGERVAARLLMDDTVSPPKLLAIEDRNGTRTFTRLDENGAGAMDFDAYPEGPQPKARVVGPDDGPPPRVGR